MRQLPVAERDDPVVAPDLLADAVLALAQTHSGGALWEILFEPVKCLGNDGKRVRFHLIPDAPPSSELVTWRILARAWSLHELVESEAFPIHAVHERE